MTPEPFSLHVPDEVLDDLRERLDRTRFPDEVPGSDWRLGTNLAYMRDLVDYWRDGFDWRAQEAELNAFDQYRVELTRSTPRHSMSRWAEDDPTL